MRLPDFRLDKLLNDLKQKMGLRSDEYGSFDVTVTPGGLTVRELEKLVTEGIDVDWREITFLPDGTPSYKGNRVLLYIRDVHPYDGQWKYPRYHLTTCSTLKQQNRNGRLSRYVVAAKPDGVFHINRISSVGTRSERIQLRVCKNCLNELAFDGIGQMSALDRERFVGEFTPAHFFAKYPQSLHTLVPLNNSEDGPLNNYSPDFPEVSKKTREKAKWRCSACLVDLSESGLRKYLHTHHCDGHRGNNSPENLRVLCIGCHSEQPDHGHLKGNPDYVTYCRLRPTIRIG